MDVERLSSSRSISILCSLGLFLSGCLFFTSALIEPYYAAQFHLSAWQLGIAQSAVPLGAMIGAIQAGWLADKFGRHRILQLSFMLLAISGIIGSLAYNFDYLCVSRFTNGYLAGTLYPLCAAYLIEMTEPHLVPRKVATMMFINCFASPTACVLVLILSHFVNDRVLWHILAGMHVVPAVVAYLWSRRFPESNTWLFFMETGEHSANETNFRTKLKILFSPAYRNVTVCLLGSWFLMDVAYYGINFFIPHLLSSISTSKVAFSGQTPAILNKTFVINAFFGMGAMLSILAVQKIDQYKLQKYGFFVSGLSLLVLGYYFYSGMQHVYYIVALFIMFNFAITVGPNVTTYLLPATSYPVEVRATGHGLSSGMAKLGCFLGVLMLPALQTSLGYGLILVSLSVLLFIGYALTSMLARAVVADEMQDKDVDVCYDNAA